MSLEHNLQQIFNADYPGHDVFLQEVIKPVLKADIISVDVDLLAQHPEYRPKAELAHIKQIKYVADIDSDNSYNIAFLDVKVDNRKRITQSRVAIQQLIRSIMDAFTHIFIVFHYEDAKDQPWRFSYAYKEDTIAGMTSAKRFTYLFGRDYRSRTAAQRFEVLAKGARTDADILKAFSVEALSDEFFDGYRDLYADFVQFLTGKRYEKRNGKWVEVVKHEPDPQLATSFENDDKLARDYVKKMFGRIVFLYFLQRKGWLAGNRNYMHDLFYSSDKKDNFLDGVLEPLFFELLNTRPEYRSAEALALPDADKIPYLNGGLFQQDEIDERTCVFPENYFKRLFDFFDQYNFTIDENDPEDAEIGIDPEMLGRIFENLLEDNKDKGAFYTPKEIVEYMCRESIIAYLQNGLPERSHNLIRTFVETLDAEPLNEDQRIFLKKKLIDVKICDPAIGSGAFPMGMVNMLSKIYTALGLVSDRSKMKRHIMEKSIYGVDIEKGAVDIARLRFWLAMVVDASEPEPLPNLHFKIMQGNSLLETYEGVDLSKLVGVQSDNIFWSQAEVEHLQANLIAYYNTTDHHDRDRIAREIHNSIIRQLINTGIPEEKLVGLDPTETDKFFLWHTWFADVFKRGGFDIVIGNPPYIDSETMTKVMPDVRDSYSSKYAFAKGNWDIYILFYELGLNVLKENGILTYIVPNKWLSIGYGKAMRAVVFDYLTLICDCRATKVFEAGNEPIISLMVKGIRNRIRIAKSARDSSISDVSCLNKESINVDNLGMCISPFITLLTKIKEANGKVSDISSVENPFTTGEAYELIPLVSENSTAQDYKLINTGTVDPFINFWGQAKTAYLKNKFDCPHVNKKEFHRLFPRRVRQVESSKLILSGMRNFEAFYDRNAQYVAGKSTIIILPLPQKEEMLAVLLGLLNSRLMKFYIYQSYSTLGIGGGINFSKDMVASLPLPELWKIKEVGILATDVVDAISAKDGNRIFFDIKEIDLITYRAYNLTYDEVLIVDPETPITREEYESHE